MSEILGRLRSDLAPFGHACHEGIDAAAGLYSFWLRGCCLYVGMSEDLRRRVLEHETAESNARLAGYFKTYPREIKISAVRVEGTPRDLRRLESAAICKLRPVANRRGRGESR